MKTLLLISFSLITSLAHAQNRTVICKDLVSLEEILRFNSLEQKGSVSRPEYDLEVKTLGDNILSMNLLSHFSSSTVEGIRTNEQLKVSLAGENVPAVSTLAGTRRGLAQATLRNTEAAVSASITSYERKGESRMEIHFMETAGVKNILCETVR